MCLVNANVRKNDNSKALTVTRKTCYIAIILQFYRVLIKYCPKIQEVSSKIRFTKFPVDRIANLNYSQAHWNTRKIILKIGPVV